MTGHPNMQSENVAASSLILSKSTKACITHCCYHNLNLSIVQCANIQVINKITEQYKTLQIYFQTSPKRKKSFRTYCIFTLPWFLPTKSAHRDVYHNIIRKWCLVWAFLSCNSTYGWIFWSNEWNSPWVKEI